MKDQQIVALFFERSEQAIVELSGKYGAAVRGIAMNILRNSQDAEECANDTYLKVWNCIPPKRPEHLGAYTCRIARNLSLNRYHAAIAQKRNSQYDAALDELEETVPALETVESQYDAKELSGYINRFLKELTYNDRYMFVRRYWFGESVGQIAENMGVKSHSVSVRLFRIRQRLQDYLCKEGMIV